MPRTVLISLIAALVAITLPASTDPPFSRVTVYDGMLSMSMPDDWQEIDFFDLEELTMWAADVTAGRLVEVYQHGFRPRASGPDRLLPTILVQIRESGRQRYGRFVHLKSLDAFQSDTSKTFPEGLRPLVMGVGVDHVDFDASTYCLRLEHSLDLRIKGRVTVLTAAFLTERGFVTLRYSDREKRMDEGRRFFNRIVDSVSLAPEIAYRPQLSDRWPGLPFFIAAALVAAALAAYLVQRHRTLS